MRSTMYNLPTNSVLNINSIPSDSSRSQVPTLPLRSETPLTCYTKDFTITTDESVQCVQLSVQAEPVSHVWKIFQVEVYKAQH